MQRIQQFWLQQTQAEYASSAITVQYVHWLQRIGASPDLIKQGLRIADDEMHHAELAFAVAVEAGATALPAMDDQALAPALAFADIRQAIFQRNLRFYCLGETVAVPLFKAMRREAKQPSVLAAYDRILQDEGRHSDYGWLGLAWMMEQWPESNDWLTAMLPEALHSLRGKYVTQQEYHPPLSAEEKAWGMMPQVEYTEIFEQTVQGAYAKQLGHYGLLLDDFLSLATA